MKDILIIVLALSSAMVSCISGDHLITDKSYLGKVEKDFSERKSLASQRDSELFGVFNSSLSTQQKEALEYLYAYMPLNDLADYDGSFFLANADAVLATRTTTEWGKTIPENIFLHYVLPYRVNNENLDSFRIKYSAELRDRIKGLSIKDAALEINHWCHEKVAYQPSDGRTSAPLSTMLSGRGRCGEESTFTVSALRAAGIPARQVYTPRWAHCDDNHAWVEIWDNNNWYYMGACEPDVQLDRGWFTEPARRAMLVHTKSFGSFTPGESPVVINRNFSLINNLSKYAVTKTISVRVTDAGSKPVVNATVEFQLYNYAEFYPLATINTDKNGMCSFETGLGSLIVWARKDNDFAFRKINVSETDTLTLELGSSFPDGTNLNLDLEVPIAREPFPQLPKQLVNKNAERLENENTIRKKYADTWITGKSAVALAQRLGLDTIRLKKIILTSMGNYSTVADFISSCPDSLKKRALSLLEVLSEKDLRDTKTSILYDHLVNVPPENKSIPENIYIDYLLNPRVSNEMLVAYRKFLLEKLPVTLRQSAVTDPMKIKEYIENEVIINESENYYNTPLTPCGVLNLKVSDSWSRSIFFVSVCRTLGIPARLEPGRNIPQYFTEGAWHDVYFKGQQEPGGSKGFIKFVSSFKNPEPEYYIHFTLARFENGRYNTLEYDFNKKISTFTEELELPAGHYMLVTGNRPDDSGVLASVSFFELKAAEHKTLDIVLRTANKEKQVLGKVDAPLLESIVNYSKTSQECNNNNGSVIVWIDPQKEPCNHLLNDMSHLKADFEKWGGKIIFLLINGNNAGTLQSDRFSLPANASFGSDEKLIVLKKCFTFRNEPAIDYPVVVAYNKAGDINYISTGYRIGSGEQILRSFK